MNDARRDLLPIGGFASASHLSIKALRLYDQLGLLQPYYLDPESGYRYYHAGQLPAARLIRMLRQIGMPLATIRQVLMAAFSDERGQPGGAAGELVLDYWRAQEKRMEQARLALHDILATLGQEKKTMTLDVQVKTAAPQPVLSLTRRVKVARLDEHIRESLGKLYAAAEAQGLAAAGAPFGIYHGPINDEEDGPIEVCLPVQGTGAAGGEVEARVLPGGRSACVEMRGAQCDFPAVLAGYDAACDWVQRNGYDLAEPPREIWYRAPGADAHMEVAWPFQERAA